jgi:hypothetical protein
MITHIGLLYRGPRLHDMVQHTTTTASEVINSLGAWRAVLRLP